jgi:hypothetical protein
VVHHFNQHIREGLAGVVDLLATTGRPVVAAERSTTPLAGAPSAD